MKIVVMSNTKEQAERLWRFHIAPMFSGYEKPVFVNSLLKNLDGLDRSKLVIILAGGYKPNNKQEALAFAWYLEEGAMFIDFNKVNMESDKDRFKREYLGEFVNSGDKQ